MPGLAQNANVSTFKAADFKKRVDDSLAGMKTATTSKDAAERTASAEKLADDLAAAGAAAAASEMKLWTVLRKSLKAAGKSGANERAGALAVVEALAKKGGVSVEPFILDFIVIALDLLGDKAKFVRGQASTAVDAIFAAANPSATYKLLPLLLKSVHSVESNVKRLELISFLCKNRTAEMGRCLGEAIPAVAGDMHDIKKQIASAAVATMTDLCNVCKNVDVEPLLPTMASALKNHAEMPECVYKLASTTFVQEIESDTLSILNPILTRGFNDASSKIIRASARIVENMAKLVEHPRDVEPFMPTLLPLMEKARDNVSDPEVRNVCGQAVKVLIAKADTSNVHGLQDKDVLPVVQKFVAETLGDAKLGEIADAFVTYAAALAIALNDARRLEVEDWLSTLGPYLETFASAEQAKEIAEKVHGAVAAAANQREDLEDPDAEKLCDCDFSLAYGNKVLLKKTRLVLHRGYRYGLIGKNDSGKTSLMRAIAEYRVEGFPTQDVLKTMFVETDIPSEESDKNIIDYVVTHPTLSTLNLTNDIVLKTLTGFGFTDDSPAPPTSMVGQLSGGWRMKLALARAKLLNADILLLDEPTNHLDAYNVKWVEDWLLDVGAKGVTCIMVSHDSGLLDRVCTNMVQIENLKLHWFKGNLSAFVEKRPDAKSFFELKTEKFKFTFPQPGALQGVSSKGKAILKMNDITFTYPGAPKAQLNHVTVQVSLASRVACVGINGAGKSTMIKLLTGELEPDEGSGDVYKHPNCRVGYIAQHAFHHIENHLDKTANEYICWRYRNGNDREELVKVTTIVTEEDEKRMKEPVPVEFVDPSTGDPLSSKRKIKGLTEGRRENKLKKDQEYEVQLADDKVSTSLSFWCTRTNLIKYGWEKIVNEIDGRIATRAAMFAHPLTQVNVKNHLANIGLEEEFSTHMRIGALSGGQKVKVVLAAAMWNRPHILILDEPTNYLDRDSLGALAAAIREFDGGVVMITHNSQFCDDLCPEVWHLQNNTLDRKGDSAWMAQDQKIEEKKQALTAVDKFGNTIQLKKQYTAKEQKKRDKIRKKINKQRKKEGLEPLSTDNDDF
jgi:elongation factor 3